MVTSNIEQESKFAGIEGTAGSLATFSPDSGRPVEQARGWFDERGFGALPDPDTRAISLTDALPRHCRRKRVLSNRYLHASTPANGLMPWSISTCPGKEHI